MKRKNLLFLIALFAICIDARSQSAPYCPSINAQFGTGPSTTICQGNCATLSSSVVPINLTSTYSVQSIPYVPFAFTGGTAVSVNTDDVWSAVVNLPFNFCYFGNVYTQCILGSNGQLSFSLGNASAYDNWQVTSPIPSTADMPGNTICAAFRDIDPSQGGTMKYYFSGTAPCRSLVLYWSNVPLFSCSTPYSTFQLVLHETTNYIDIFVQNSSGSCAWNSSRGIIGIQNAAATVAYTPPARNMGGWTAVNEGWRFVPTGAQTYTVNWASPAGPVGTGLSVNVCPLATTNYTSTMSVAACTGPVTTFTSVVQVSVVASPTLTANSATICQGSTANLSVSGANTYTWQPGNSNATSINVSPASSTVYTVSGTNGPGCVTTKTVMVTVNPNPAATTTNTNPTCSLSNGVIQINNTSPPVQTVTGFSVNGSSVGSQTITALPAGSYVVSLVNNFGCTFSMTTVLPNGPGITNMALTSTSASCIGNNGAINIGAITGGTGPYQYNFNGGPFGPSTSFTSLAPGTYTIGVHDASGCPFTKTITVLGTTGPTNLTFTTSPTACVGNTGVIGITGVTGGTAAYSFSVDGVGTGSVTGSMALGPHTVLVSDANGCTFSITANVPIVSGPTSAVIAVTSAACGNANGSATVTSVTGGAPAYQYSFNGGPFVGSTIQGGMLAGPKSVVIKDANSCTLTVNFTIGNTGSPSSAIATLTNVSCFGGANGGFSVTTSGGTPGYSYTLTPGNITNGFGSFSNLTAGTYTVNVKDALGCVTTVVTTISQPAALTLNLSMNQPSCNGGNNGTITATAGGGTSPYVYNLNGGPNQASNVFNTNITAGAYNITVIDNLGCSLSQTITVTQPTPITYTISSSPANCSTANGSGSVAVSGGTPIYTYTWSPTGGNNAQTTGVAAGNYTVLIKDTKNCTITAVTSVSATPGGTAVVTNTTNVSCFGAANGSLTANMIGNATAPLTYSWSNGPTNQTNGPLAPGSYTVSITDFYGCKSNAVGTITQPSSITVTPAGSPALCFGGATGSATVIATGGTPGYNYLWSPNGSTTTVASGLTAGTYSVQVTDLNGCTSTKTVTITQPSSVTINTSTLTAACSQSNGAASATATGGTGPYTYTWSTSVVGQSITNVYAGTYTIQVKDANGCLYTLAATVPNASGPAIGISSFTNPSCFSGNNGIATTTISGGTPGPGFPVYIWSNGQNTGTATNLMNGVYTVTLTDAAGCKASASVTIVQPTALTLSVTSTNPKCFNATNGTANAGVLGGTPAYTYAWLPTPGSGGTTATPGGMGPGNYNVTVTDAKGCIIQGTVALGNPLPMLSSVSSTNVTCFNACNGHAIASATNAVGAVSYYYTGGPSPLTTQSVSGLCAGTYSMLATDQNTCTSVTVFTISQPPLLTVSISAVGTPSCNGYSNGFATSSPAGGTPGYTYNWSNSQTSATANNLIAGSYTITVTDTKSCTATAVAVVNQPAGLTTVVTHTNITCFGANNGIGNVNYSGGTGIPTILWQPTLANTQYVNILTPGTHTVTLTDANSCTVQSTFTITQPPQLVVNITTVVPTNCGQANGSTSVAAAGGAGGYTYQWSSNPAFTNASIVNVIAQAYTVTVTDANGCSVSTNTVIPNIAAPVVLVTATVPVLCFGQANGGATVSVSGGAGGNTYLWSYLAQTTQNVNNLPSGLHSITVTDAAGCLGGAVVNITQPTQLVTAVGSVTNVACSSYSNGAAQMLAVGGTTSYAYLWQPSAQTNSVLTGVGSGVYTCTVTDANGCTSSKTFNITQPNPLLITTNTVIPNNCFGFATGQVNTSITGGTPTYTLTWSPAQPANPIITNLTAGSYTLSVIDSKGCPTSSVYTLTDPSALTIQGTSTTQATCGNSNGTASVSISGGSPNYAYNWNTSNPQISAGASSLPPGQWVLTTTDAKGCVITASVTITAAIQPSVTAVSTNIKCFGQGNGSATLTATGVGGFSYNWSPSGLTTAIVNGLGPAIHSATVTDVNGCHTYTSVNISEPNVLALNVSPPQTICYGNIATLFAQASGGSPAYSYTLTDLVSSISTSSTTPNGMNATPTLTSTTQYTIAVTDFNGCTNGPQTIIVNVRPALIAVGSATTICDTKTVTLKPNFISQGNGAPYNFNWSNNTTGPVAVVTANYNAPNPNTYSVIIDDGCSIPNTVATFSVFVNPSPKASFTPTLSQGCAPLTVTYNGIGDSTTTNPNPFFWTFGGGTTGSNASAASQVVIYPEAGTYSLSLTVTNKYGCQQFMSDPVAAQAYPVPVAGFFPSPQSVSLMEPTINFTNTSTNANSYVWDFGDYDNANTNSSYSMNTSHLYSYVGTYKIYMVAINSQGCKDTANATIDITPDMGVYIPNAFTPDGNGRNDIFLPYGYGISEDNYKMEIYDRWGELIFSSNDFRKGWDGSVKGSSVIAKDGVYIYKIQITDLEKNKKSYVGHVTLLKQ